MEQLGLIYFKDENGEYVARGNRNIKINGENIKPIFADAVNQLDNVEVINHLNISDYIVEDNTIKGAFGFHMENGAAYEIRAKKVLCATGGQQDFISQTIRDSQDIRCGIHHLIQEPDMRWELMQEQR